MTRWQAANHRTCQATLEAGSLSLDGSPWRGLTPPNSACLSSCDPSGKDRVIFPPSFRSVGCMFLPNRFSFKMPEVI